MVQIRASLATDLSEETCFFLLVWSCKAISHELRVAFLLKDEASIKRSIDER